MNTIGLRLTLMKFHKPLLAFKMPKCGVLNVKKSVLGITFFVDNLMHQNFATTNKLLTCSW